MQIQVNKILFTGNVISFQSAPSLDILCISINSRPGVSLTIVNTMNNLTLPQTLENPQNPFQICDARNICQTQLQITLTPGYIYWNNINSITCYAYNNTAPLEIHNSITYLLDNIGKI